MNVKKIIPILAIAGFCLVTLTTFNFPKQAEEAKEIVLFHAASDISAAKSAYIKQVSLIEQDCNQLKYKVSYISTNDSKGYFRLSASSKVTDNNYEGFRGDHSPKLINGAHTTEYSEWITTERKSAKTYELWVSIEEIADKKFYGITDRVKIKFTKEWDHLCL